MTDRQKLAELGYRVAQNLDDRGVLEAGIVRQLARALLEPPTDHGCPGCGGHIQQPPTGRRRVWCSEACRSRARRRPGTDR